MSKRKHDDRLIEAYRFHRRFMSTYRINREMLGDEGTDDRARRMVEALRARGHDVEFTEDAGLVNGANPDSPISDAEWDEALAGAMLDAESENS